MPKPTFRRLFLQKRAGHFVPGVDFHGVFRMCPVFQGGIHGGCTGSHVTGSVVENTFPMQIKKVRRNDGQPAIAVLEDLERVGIRLHGAAGRRAKRVEAHIGEFDIRNGFGKRNFPMVLDIFGKTGMGSVDADDVELNVPADARHGMYRPGVIESQAAKDRIDSIGRIWVLSASVEQARVHPMRVKTRACGASS